MNKEIMIATPADPNDPEDWPISVAAWERGIMGRRIRQYEIGRHVPNPSVRAYLKVTEAKQEMVRRVMAG